jgi:hypothetical protein
MARAGVWLNSPSAELAGDTPIARLTAGDYASVDAALDHLEQNPPA